MDKSKTRSVGRRGRLTSATRAVLLRQHVSEIIAAGYAVDLPTRYLPKSLRFSEKVRRWRVAQG